MIKVKGSGNALAEESAERPSCGSEKFVRSEVSSRSV